MEAYSQTSKRETAPAPSSDQEKRARPLDAAGIGWSFCQYSLFEPSATLSKTLCVLIGLVRLRTYYRRAQKYGDRVLIFIYSSIWVPVCGWEKRKEEAMQEKQRVSDMAVEVLTRQARGHAKRTGEPLEDALKAILDTEAGRQLGELRDGPLHDESAQQWQEDLPRKRAEERRRARREERRHARLAAWKEFMQEERRELELRKGGQLARMLGEPLPREPRAEMLRLASEDRKQAEEGLVALMSDGEVFYKHLEDLSLGDVPTRIAATSSRTAWLKERQEDRWFGRETG